MSGGTQTPSCLEALKLHHRVWRHHRHAAVGWRLHSPAACQSHRKLAAPHSGRARYRSCWCRTLAAPHSGRARHRPATGDGRRLTAPRSGRVRYHPRWRQTDARGTAERTREAPSVSIHKRKLAAPHSGRARYRHQQRRGEATRRVSQGWELLITIGICSSSSAFASRLYWRSSTP